MLKCYMHIVLSYVYTIVSFENEQANQEIHNGNKNVVYEKHAKNAMDVQKKMYEITFIIINISCIICS